MNSSWQSMPNKTITQTDLSLSIRPNTTVRKQSSVYKVKCQRKTSSIQPFQSRNYNNIIQNANNELQEYLFNLDEHLKRVIEKRQASYLTAFENHMGFVEKELKKIKQSYEQSKLYEKAVSLEEVIIRLQRQCEIFRNQAMRYFQLLQQKQQQLKTTQRQSSNLQKQLQISQFTKKKLIQKLKHKLSEQEMIIIDNETAKEYRLFQRSRAKSSKPILDKQQQIVKNSNDNNYKFRKTLMEFNLKNSSQYFRQQTAGGKSARSYITHGSTIDGGRKSMLYNQKGNRDWVMNDVENNVENNKSFNRTHHQRFHSQTKLNNYLTLQVGEDRKDKHQPMMDDYHRQQLKDTLKAIILDKFIQEQKNNALILQFNFNSEQSINDFIDYLFPNTVKIEEIGNLQTPEKKQLTYTQNETFLAQFISPDAKRLKAQNNLMSSSIYSISKGQKSINAKQSLLYSTKHKIIAISKKKSTLKNKVITAQWTDLQIHRKKPQQKQQPQNNSDTKQQK